MYTYSYLPIINRPTRVSTDTATLIEHIRSNDLESNFKSGILRTDISDHFCLFCFAEADVSSSCRTEIKYHDFSQPKIDLFRDRVNGIVNFQNFRDVNCVYNSFIDNLINLIDECFPVQTKLVKAKALKKPWITYDLQLEINQRNKLYNKFIKRPITFEEQYKRFRNRLNLKIKNAKISYFNNKLDECMSSSKKTWSVLNTILGNKSRGGPQIESLIFNGNNVNSSQSIANCSNNYFSSIGTNLSRDIPQTNFHFSDLLMGDYQNSIMLRPVSCTEISNIINSLKDSGPGFDNVSTKILKMIHDLITDFLTSIINSSFENGVFPDKSKIAKIIPVFKSGNKNDIANYRPNFNFASNQ